MRLDQLKKNEEGIIVNIDAEKTLKSRFNSFGITKGTKISVVTTTMAKETIEIKVNRTKIALRVSEAAKIEIEQC